MHLGCRLVSVGALTGYASEAQGAAFVLAHHVHVCAEGRHRSSTHSGDTRIKGSRAEVFKVAHGRSNHCTRDMVMIP